MLHQPDEVLALASVLLVVVLPLNDRQADSELFWDLIECAQLHLFMLYLMGADAAAAFEGAMGTVHLVQLLVLVLALLVFILD